MENQLMISPTDHQGSHEVPPAAEHPGPALQQNMPAYQQGEGPATQNCSCAQCSARGRTQAGPPTWYPVDQQDPRYFGSANIPYLGQCQEDVSTPAENALTEPDRARVQFAQLQTVRSRDNLGYTPIHDQAGPSNMGIPTQTPDESIMESRRRFASRCLNNPNAIVSPIRLEPGPSGRFQLIITLEMTNLM